METIPNLYGKVIYPKGIPLDKRTIYNFILRKYDDSLINKVPNEFKYMLKNYNHRNTGIVSWYIDTNNYNHF